MVDRNPGRQRHIPSTEGQGIGRIHSPLPRQEYAIYFKGDLSWLIFRDLTELNPDGSLHYKSTPEVRSHVATYDTEERRKKGLPLRTDGQYFRMVGLTQRTIANAVSVLENGVALDTVEPATLKVIAQSRNSEQFSHLSGAEYIAMVYRSDPEFNTNARKVDIPIPPAPVPHPAKPEPKLVGLNAVAPSGPEINHRVEFTASELSEAIKFLLSPASNRYRIRPLNQTDRAELQQELTRLEEELKLTDGKAFNWVLDRENLVSQVRRLMEKGRRALPEGSSPIQVIVADAFTEIDEKSRGQAQSDFRKGKY